MSDQPDATMTIVADCVFGRDGAPNAWSLWAMPLNGDQSQRMALGTGPVGSGIMIPVATLDTFWQGQKNA